MITLISDHSQGPLVKRLNSVFETEWWIWSMNWDKLQIFNFATNVNLTYLIVSTAQSISCLMMLNKSSTSESPCSLFQHFTQNLQIW